MLIIKWIISVISIMLAAWLISGIGVASWWTALWLALLLGVLNVIVKPVLILLTLPINIVTLGLFTFVINALMILLASTVVKGFMVEGFWAALLFSVVISVISYGLNVLVGSK